LSLVLLLNFLYLTFDTFRNVGKTEMLMPVFNVLLIIAGTYLDYRDKMDRPITFLTIAIVISSMFSYIWLHLQFARAHEEDMKAQQRLQIMMSQMQPHFLFNTLATVQALCSTDPEKAAKITGKFGKYLRQNIDSLEQDIRIPFDKEMEHTLNYADIEMVRFPNIRVETDLQDQDFTIPALTVQPIVENAIRHGVRICEEGVVRISSRKDGHFHEIVIEDNGKGFDTDSLDAMKGLHLGIRNVRERIEKMCKGSLDIQSEPGNGTVVTIRIPEEE
jgi:LytS/YehU family sensor histidine kinase